MLLMVEKGNRGGVCHAYIDMQKQIINIWTEDHESSHIQYLNEINLNMSQTLPVNSFK